jgi:hypothetical protein
MKIERSESRRSQAAIMELALSLADTGWFRGADDIEAAFLKHPGVVHLQARDARACIDARCGRAVRTLESLQAFHSHCSVARSSRLVRRA